MTISPDIKALKFELPEELDFEQLHFAYPELFNFSGNFSDRPVHFSIPGLKNYQSSEIQSCGKNRWPALSITGSDCVLQCDHCGGRILESMQAVCSPESLWSKVVELVDNGINGFLITGGSNRNNQVEYAPFLPVIEKIKTHFPQLRIACHTALMSANEVSALEQSGIDIAMMDVIGALDTIRQVYHLRKQVDDFEKTLEVLCASGMKVVPHVVLGLHYGYFLGEWQALEIIRKHTPDALVLVIAMPAFAQRHRPFKNPHPINVSRLFRQARQALPNIPIQLGCARPPGRYKTLVDSLAVLSGLDGIAYPAEGVVEFTRSLGRRFTVGYNCCSDFSSDIAELAGRSSNESFAVRSEQVVTFSNMV